MLDHANDQARQYGHDDARTKLTHIHAPGQAEKHLYENVAEVAKVLGHETLHDHAYQLVW